MLFQACVAWMAGVKKGEGREEEQLERKKGEGACTMIVSYLIHVNKLLIVGQPIRHFCWHQPAKVRRNEQKGVLIAGVPPQSTLPFHPCHAS